MGSVRHDMHEVVELLAASGRWPAGTVGTVVEVDDTNALVEVDDDRGHAADFISVPHDVLIAASERTSRAAS